MPAAIFRHESDAVTDGIGRRCHAGHFAADAQLAGLGRREAEDRTGQLGPPRPDETGQPENLSTAH